MTYGTTKLAKQILPRRGQGKNKLEGPLARNVDNLCGIS